MDKFFKTKIAGYALIQGTQFPITSFTVVYAVDKIPTAEFSIPLGMSGKGGIFAASFLSTLVPYTPIEIWLDTQSFPGGRDAPVPGAFPSPLFRVFVGYLDFGGMVKNLGEAGITVRAFGRLGALSSATTLVESLVEAQTDSGARKMLSGLGKTLARITSSDALFELITEGSLSAAIVEIFNQLATQFSAWSSASTKPVGSELAVEALARIVPKSQLSVKPYAAQMTEGKLRRAIAISFVDILFSTWSMSTLGSAASADLWTALAGLRQEFLFSIIPTVERDYIAALTPTLNSSVQNVIHPYDYASLSLGSRNEISEPTLVTRICVYARSFQSSAWNDGPEVSGIIGFKELSDQGDNSLRGGRTEVVSAPSWILPVGAEALTGFKDAAEVKAFADSASPISGKPEDSQKNDEIAMFHSELGARYAETYLFHNLFDRRTIQISGRLRFDIAPGNQVKLFTPGSGVAGNSDREAVLYGMASQVQTMVSNVGDSGQASTMITISSVRTEKEQGLFTTRTHPLYLEAWDNVRLA